MAQNERYRDRVDLDDAAQEASAELIDPVQESLEALRVNGTITVDGVRLVLESHGLQYPQVRGRDDSVAFGASMPTGGCLFGGVTDDEVTIDVGGYILDGGCLPAQ